MVSYLGRLFQRFRSRLEQPTTNRYASGPENEIVIEVNTVYSTTPFLQVYFIGERIFNFRLTLDGKTYENHFPDIGPGEHEVYVVATDKSGRKYDKHETITVK